MKYILMMIGTKAGVDTYRAWSNSDIQAHFAFLKSLNKELSESGELVAKESGTRLRDRRPVIGGAGTRWGADQHADRSAADHEQEVRRTGLTSQSRPARGFSRIAGADTVFFGRVVGNVENAPRAATTLWKRRNWRENERSRRT